MVRVALKSMRAKRIASAFLVAAMLTTGSFASVLAGNTADTSYEFHNTNVSGNTGFREKNDTTKVYIHPTSGPELYFTVQAANSSYGSNCISASGRYRVGNSVQASFTNWVHESGRAYARLHIERTTYANTMSYGLWSPDSTQNYTVFG
ncbi:MAG: hypothetical protein LKM40_07055 [Mageeibacillus sp.]|jgi:hypothetical protein|nr:hypothetical protein [Mageeibacillus sp.]